MKTKPNQKTTRRYKHRRRPSPSRDGSRLRVALETLEQIASLPRGGRGKRLASATVTFLKTCMGEE